MTIYALNLKPCCRRDRKGTHTRHMRIWLREANRMEKRTVANLSQAIAIALFLKLSSGYGRGQGPFYAEGGVATCSHR